MFLNKQLTLDVPVYTVWGACEDVRVLEKFRSGEYKVHNLHIIDEANSRLLDVGGVKLRLLGLGGAVVMHKLFDNGEGRTTIAGGGGTMWTTLLQMGELVDTANRVYDPTETRLLVTHASPAREGLLNQLSVTLKADFSISAGLHFRYGSSYNEFSVNPSLDHYRGKLAASKASFTDVWETVKNEVEPAIDQNDAQKTLLSNALDIVTKMPGVANGGNPFGGPVGGPNAGGQVDESAFKNMWNFNLADAAFGWLVLEVDGGRIGTEMKAQGFNFAHRGTRQSQHAGQQQAIPPLTGSGAPVTTGGAPSQSPAAAPAGAPPTRVAQNQQFPQRNSSTQQAQQSKPADNRETSSPVAPGNLAQVKPATPQPTGQTVNLPPSTGDKKSSGPVPNEPARNGTAPKENATAKPTPTKNASPVDKATSSALFIQNVETEEAARNLFDEADREKIVRMESRNRAWVAHFKDNEEMKAVFGHMPESVKTGSFKSGSPNVRIYENRSYPQQRQFSQRGDSQGEGGAGRWQGSTRGGANSSGPTGYKSGSESDGMRGRGGRGGRGSFRGERGTRGTRGQGRGTFKSQTSGGEGGAPAAAAAAAATPTTPSGES